MIEDYDPSCPLCRLANDREILSRVVFEDDFMIVVDCIVCRTPMAVLKAHRPSFTPAERDRVRLFFRSLLASEPLPFAEDTDLNQVYGGAELLANPNAAEWVIDWEQRQIPDHAHCHLRPKHFPGTKRWERLVGRAV